MYSLEFKAKTLKSLESLIKQGFVKPVSDAVFEIMNFAETKAKQNIRKAVYDTPSKTYRRTGKAQQSIIGQKTGKFTAKVFMGVKYGKYLEEGTGIYVGRQPWYTRLSNITGNSVDSKVIKIKGMKARPFWAPTVKETSQNMNKIAKARVDKFIKTNI